MKDLFDLSHIEMFEMTARAISEAHALYRAGVLSFEEYDGIFDVSNAQRDAYCEHHYGCDFDTWLDSQIPGRSAA